MCFAGAVANVANSGCCNPKVPSSTPAGGKDTSHHIIQQESLIT